MVSNSKIAKSSAEEIKEWRSRTLQRDTDAPARNWRTGVGIFPSVKTDTEMRTVKEGSQVRRVTVPVLKKRN